MLLPARNKRRYGSYLGEISPAQGNLLNRDFPAATPNEKWLIVGCTRQKGLLKVDFGAMRLRESQCRNWLIANQREPHRWLAIEDDPLNFKAREHVVFTDHRLGFRTQDAECVLELARRLRGGSRV